MDRYSELLKRQRLEEAEGRAIQMQRYQEADSVYQNNTHETDNVYYNVIIDHSEIQYYADPSGAVGPLLNPPIIRTSFANYEATRDNAILDKASDYYLAITRFAIPLDTVPVMIMQVIPNTAHLGLGPVGPNGSYYADLTPYIIGINYLGVNYSNNLIYTANTVDNRPIQNEPLQIITPYYYVYSYNLLINMANIALARSWVSSGLATIFPNFIPPYFIYNTTNIVFIIPDCFHRITSPLTTIPEIYINAELITFFTPFQYIFNGNNQVDGKNFIFLLSNAPPNTIQSNITPFYPSGITPPPLPLTYVPPTGLPQSILTDYWQLSSEYSTYPSWDSLRKIVLVSNTMPVRSEGIPSTNPNNPGLSSGLPILADFIPNIEFAGDFGSIAHYTPGTYKLVDLLSDLPLTKIDIQVYWQDRNQNLYPLQLSVFQTASIKIGFFRKNLYKDFRADYGGIKY